MSGPATADTAMEEAFLGNLTAGQPLQLWMVDLEVRDHIIPFKLDTTEQTYHIAWDSLSSTAHLESFMNLPTKLSAFWAS